MNGLSTSRRTDNKAFCEWNPGFGFGTAVSSLLTHCLRTLTMPRNAYFSSSLIIGFVNESNFQQRSFVRRTVHDMIKNNLRNGTRPRETLILIVHQRIKRWTVDCIVSVTSITVYTIQVYSSCNDTKNLNKKMKSWISWGRFLCRRSTFAWTCRSFLYVPLTTWYFTYSSGYTLRIAFILLLHYRDLEENHTNYETIRYQSCYPSYLKTGLPVVKPWSIFGITMSSFRTYERILEEDSRWKMQREQCITRQREVAVSYYPRALPPDTPKD